MGESTMGESGAAPTAEQAQFASQLLPGHDRSDQCSENGGKQGEDPARHPKDKATRVASAARPDTAPMPISTARDETLNAGFQVGKKTRRKRLLRLKVKATAVSQLTWSHVCELMKDPVNVAVLIWILLAIPACVIIGLKEVGLLQAIIGSETTSEKVDEIAHQIMNALFVLAVGVVLPLLVRHTYLLIRWRPRDKVELRKCYCKQGFRKPHDRTHMAIVVFWGQLTCWTTLGYAAAYWFWPASQRSDAVLWALGITSWVAPILGLLYLLLSPLSGDFDIVKEGDEQMLKMYPRSHAFFLDGRSVKEPQWNGSAIPSCCAEWRTACLVCFLPCCMFGYNMERLGFGHRAVQAFAFAIVLLGPLLVFELSAAALGAWGASSLALYLCGLTLALLGCAYGGLWRTHIRQVYRLPGSKICCGSACFTDICLWMWCGYCALCQEIRTADQYQIEDVEASGEMGQQPYTFGSPSEQSYGEDGDDSETWEECEKVAQNPQLFYNSGHEVPTSSPPLPMQGMKA